MPERFESHARTFSLLTVVSRVSGLFREASLSRVFGAGPLMDAFFFAFMIPNLFRRLFGEGALAAALLPTYAQLDRDDPATARRLASLMVSILMVGLGALMLIGEAVLYAVSAAADHGNLAVWLMMITLPYMPLVCLLAILAAMLQVHGRFGPTAAAPMILNLCLIGATLGLAPVLDADQPSQRLAHVGAVAGSVVLAGVLQVGWALWALRVRSWWASGFQPARAPMRRVMRRAGPMIVGLGVLQINTLFDGLIASYPTAVGSTILGYDFPLMPGSMAAVSFAQRLYQFPLGVFGIAVATAIYPQLARQSEDPGAFGDTVQRGLRLVAFLGLPASCGLIIVREPLTAVILQGGDFTAQDTGRISFVLLGYATAVWAYSMIHVLTRAFYARDDAATPVRVAVGVVGLNLLLNCTLIWTPLREAGLAWSTAICAVVQVSMLMALVGRHAPGAVGRPLLDSWLRAGAVTAAMAAIAGIVAVTLPATESWSNAMARLGVVVSVGALTVGALAMALRMPELRWALGGRTGPRGDGR